MLVRVVTLFWLIGATSSALAQEAFSGRLPKRESDASTKNTAESAWIDLRQHPSANSRPQSAPSWVEAVSMGPTVEINGASAKTIFRIRIAHPPGDYQVLYFRLFSMITATRDRNWWHGMNWARRSCAPTNLV